MIEYHLYVEDRQGKVVNEAIYRDYATAYANYAAALIMPNIAYVELNKNGKKIAGGFVS